MHGLALLGELDRVDRQQLVDWIYALQVHPDARDRSACAPLSTPGTRSQEIHASVFSLPRHERGRLRLPRRDVHGQRLQLLAGLTHKSRSRLRSHIRAVYLRNTVSGEQAEYQSEVYDTSNIASTYAAICMLKTLGDDLNRLNKPAIVGALRHLQDKQTGW